MFDEFEKNIGVSFSGKALLKEALTHRSYLNENPSWDVPHNERLEFLGDAVLELVVTATLFERYPDFEEGKLTALRAALVNTRMLSKSARKAGIEDVLCMSKGEAQDIGRARDSLLADAFEAVLGAIYLDQGYDASLDFVSRFVLVHADEIVENNLYRDTKSYFQEVAQDRFKVTPTYRVLKETGPDHKKEFRVGVFLENKKIAEGIGASKQEAETEAAREGLEVIQT